MFEHILLATEGSPACGHATTLAIELGASRPVPVLVARI